MNISNIFTRKTKTVFHVRSVIKNKVKFQDRIK